MSVSLARALLAAALIVITVLALLPQSQVPVTTFWDKSDHVLAFAALGWLASCAFANLRYATAIAPALLGYGALLECLQALTATRFGSVADLVADLVGLLLVGAWLKLRVTMAGSTSERST